MHGESDVNIGLGTTVIHFYIANHRNICKSNISGKQTVSRKRLMEMSQSSWLVGAPATAVAYTVVGSSGGFWLVGSNVESQFGS